MKRLILLSMTALLLAACDSNPYSNGGEKIAPQDQKPGDEDRLSKSYTLDVPVTVNCTEGYSCSFYVRGAVEGERSVITFENLPSDAFFDSRSGAVTWTPAVTSAPNGISRVHVVLVNLRGETDLSTGLQKTVVFIVNARTAP